LQCLLASITDNFSWVGAIEDHVSKQGFVVLKARIGSFDTALIPLCTQTYLAGHIELLEIVEKIEGLSVRYRGRIHMTAEPHLLIFAEHVSLTQLNLRYSLLPISTCRPLQAPCMLPFRDAQTNKLHWHAVIRDSDLELYTAGDNPYLASSSSPC
jgi:hypothetical protein